jgi:hypothetical protein
VALALAATRRTSENSSIPQAFFRQYSADHRGVDLISDVLPLGRL